MDEYEEALSQDPIIGPLLRRLQAAEQRAAATEEQTKRTTMAMIAKIKIEQMQQLKQQYPHVDEEQLWQAAAAKAQQWQQHGPNMDDVHLLMTFDERVRQAGQAAFEKGREEGRRMGPSPQPAGMPEVIIPGSGGGDFEQAEADALNDPEIRRIMIHGE